MDTGHMNQGQCRQSQGQKTHEGRKWSSEVRGRVTIAKIEQNTTTNDKTKKNIM